MNLAWSVHRNATIAPKSAGSPMTPAGMLGGSPRGRRRAAPQPVGGVSPGCTEFTVTPSPATSRASVLRKPVTPARAVFDRMSVAIGWRTGDRRDGDDPAPPARLHRGHGGLAHGDHRQQVEVECGLVGVERRRANVPGGGPPALVTRMSTPPSARSPRSTKPWRRAASTRRRPAPTVSSPETGGGGARRGAPVAAADRDAHALGASAAAEAKPRPAEAAATAAVRPCRSRDLHAATYRTGVAARLPPRSDDVVPRWPTHDYLADEGLATAVFLALRAAAAAAARGRGRRRQDRGGQGAGAAGPAASWSACSATRASTSPRRSTSGTTPASCCTCARPRRRAGRRPRPTRSRTSCTPSGSWSPAAAAGDRPRARARRRCCSIDEVDRADDEFEAFLLEILVRLRGDGARAGHVPGRGAAGGRRHLEPHPRRARRAQAPVPVPLGRAPRLRARGRDRAR